MRYKLGLKITQEDSHKHNKTYESKAKLTRTISINLEYVKISQNSKKHIKNT